nr:hypothetical protein [Tanacetum cinerariifolium]
GRHKDLERSFTSRKSVALVRNRILVYPDSDEEYEEYCCLLPLLPCFQTPQPCAILNFVHHNNEVDIDNMTIEEYARYELAMSTMKNEIQVPTQSFTSNFFNQSQHTPNPPLDKEDSLDEILDDLFKIGAKNIRKMEHELPNRCDDITDYEDKSISLQGNGIQGLHDSFYVAIQVGVCRVMLGRSLTTGKHFKSGLVGYHAEDADRGICDYGCCSRKHTWSMACMRSLHHTEQI